MARATIPGRLTWRVAEVVATRDETPTARTLVLRVPDWPGHAAGQHVDVRLTAPDGYSAVRSYSIASAPDTELVELTVERVPDGEVSSYLNGELAAGQQVEIRGPLGGWFVWTPQQSEPVQLLAGGSGLVPLMSMIRARAGARSNAPFRLLYSVRSPSSVLYAGELLERSRSDAGLVVDYAYTREVPGGFERPAGRVGAALLDALTISPGAKPTCYVCGPTEFVEAVADLLTRTGHDAARIRTERFGPTGG